MTSSTLAPHPAIFDTAEKRLRFGVGDSGEFLNNFYREHSTNRYYNALIGRQHPHPHIKAEFTDADIVCQDYLHKKGSWMKNWKKRYFILRRDIRSLCYYISKEDLTLLGSIPLDIDTRISNCQSEAFGTETNSHVIMIESDMEDSSVVRVYIRFDSFEKMKAWMLDIKNEAKSMTDADDGQTDWWTSLFQNVNLIEAKSHKTGGHENDDTFKAHQPAIPVEKTSPPSESVSPELSNHAQQLQQDVKPKSLMGVFNEVDQLCVESEPMPALKDAEGLHTIAEEMAKDLDEHQISEDESDISVVEESNGKVADGDHNKSVEESTEPITLSVVPSSKFLSKPFDKQRFLKTLKLLKDEKSPGPAPFPHVNVQRFECNDGTISALQLSLRLCKVCGIQDRLFIVVFGCSQSSSRHRANGAHDSITSSANATSPHADNRAAAPSKRPTVHYQRWDLISRTELRTVKQRLNYSESFLDDVPIFFNIVVPVIGEQYKEVKFVVYRQDNDVNNESKDPDLRNHQVIARTTLKRKILDMKSVLHVRMKITTQAPVDITVPSVKEAEVHLGIVRLSSIDLWNYRNSVNWYWQSDPYAERLYSFATGAGMALSLEQLYASRYSTLSALSILAMWANEREKFYLEKITELREQYVKSVPELELQSVTSPSFSSAPVSTPTLTVNPFAGMGGANELSLLNDEKLTSSTIDSMRQAIKSIEVLYQETQLWDEHSLTALRDASLGVVVKNNVIDKAVGGDVLRRSAWKKISAWQYATTNLNLHLLVTKHYTFQDINVHANANILAACSAPSQQLHYMPSITLGCPAAHGIKFPESNLRNVFSEIHRPEQKLEWILAIQSPSFDRLKRLFEQCPKESVLIFGKGCGFSRAEEISTLLKRRAELVRWLDICASQALGCALTTIRTVCLLASWGSATFVDVLSRSLKIGFLVMFESMLSTQGAELDMIRDLDIAALWLSLVSIRLVKKKDIFGRNDEDKLTAVKCYRDEQDRIIVDLELSHQEGHTVRQCIKQMSGYKPTNSRVLSYESLVKPNSPDPVEEFISDVEVFATVEVHGLVFTQGVNEMQTLANLSSSRDVLKQVEINQQSLLKLTEFYRHYRDCLGYQLMMHSPEMVEAIAEAQQTVLAAYASVPSLTTTPLDQRPSISSNSPPQPPVRKIYRRKSFFHPSISLSPSPATEASENAVAMLRNKVLVYNDRLMDQVHEAVLHAHSNPYDKHVDVLLKSSAMCRQIGGVISILCKSGKDRTSMGVTLENTRHLVEDLGVLNGTDCCQLMRAHGVRRMNVYANTGQSMFAFNQLQRRSLPPCYRPPHGSHAGNVLS